MKNPGSAFQQGLLICLACLIALISGCSGGDRPTASNTPVTTLLANSSQVINFPQIKSNYTISKTDAGFAVTDAQGNTQIVASNARLRFADASLALDVDGSGGQVYRLYQAAFGRAPEGAGLGYWLGKMENGVSLDSVAAGFAGSVEFKTIYGEAPSNQQVVERLYQNILHRAGEPSGIAFWVGKLDSKQASVPALLIGFSESVENKNGVLPTIAQGMTFAEYGYRYPAAPGASLLAGANVVDILGFQGQSVSGIAVDQFGNVYYTDKRRHTINKLSADGRVNVLAGHIDVAGSKDGVGDQAYFNGPLDLAVDGAGNIFVADTSNNLIRKIATTGQVTTVAGFAQNCKIIDGPIASASFCLPHGISVDQVGNLYVTESDGSLHKISTNGIVSTISNDPVLRQKVGLLGPQKPVLDSEGNIYLVTQGSNIINKISPSGQLTVLAQGKGSADGPLSQARFDGAYGLTLDGAGNFYLTDQYNETIRKISRDGIVSTFAGTLNSSGDADGLGSAARFSWPQALASDSAGNLYLSDNSSYAIRKVTPDGNVTTLATTPLNATIGKTDGQGSLARFTWPQGLTVDAAGNVFVADGMNSVRKIRADGMVSTFASIGPTANYVPMRAVVNDSAGNVYIASNHILYKVGPSGEISNFAGNTPNSALVDGTGAAASFYSIAALTIDRYGTLYALDNGAVRKISPQGVVTTVVKGVSSYQTESAGIAVDTAGNVYVSNYEGHTIHKVTPAGAATVLAGSSKVSGAADGTGSGARFNKPSGMVIDAVGNLYVADKDNSSIRKITPSGVVTTVMGQAGVAGGPDLGGQGLLAYPTALAIDANGMLYVIETNSVLRVKL